MVHSTHRALQHLDREASVSTYEVESVILQETLGLGEGEGAPTSLEIAACFFCVACTCAALAEILFLEASTAEIGALQRSQSYTHMPAVVPGGPKGTHWH
jgi:hypothetical protein